MWSGVRKSGWPMPRLMMSRPCAASALARASTAKAFSSPMRSKAAMVRSMACPCIEDMRLISPSAHPDASGISGGERDGSAFILVVAPDLQFGHPHHLEDDGDRPADQQQPVERGDWPHQAAAFGGDGIAVAERGVV